MKVLSLFSGVGGFDLGLERAGMETVFQCEWDKHATKILERHWPHVPRWDDVSTLTGRYILDHAPVIDIVAWGSPCQDLSVAGKRAGLEGSRSGLFHQGIRIIKELRKETNNAYPRISLWENVYGALNSNKGADFGVILDEMAEAGSLVQEWRVLDAQYFGVPQRRRRVFLISIFDPATAARCPDPLLPLSESVRRDTETSGTQRQEPAGTVANCLRVGSGVGERGDGSDTLIVGHRMRGFGDYTDDDTASAIKARDHKDATDLIVDNPILIDRAAFNQGTNAKYNTHISDDPITPSLVARGPHAVAVNEERTYRNVTGALLGRDSFGPNHEGARDGKLILESTLSFDTQFGSNANVFENHAPTLKASQAAPSVAYTLREREGKPGGGKGPLVSEEKSGTLAAGGNDQTIFQPAHTTAFQPGTMTRLGGGVWEEIAPTLRAEAKRGDNEPHIATTMAVRRLTPIECERLMGWPDNWTDGQADTHRYKQCGNGVASPVATWIAHHLQQLDKEPNATPTQTPTTQIPSTPTPQTPPTHLR